MAALLVMLACDTHKAVNGAWRLLVTFDGYQRVLFTLCEATNTLLEYFLLLTVFHCFRGWVYFPVICHADVVGS